MLFGKRLELSFSIIKGLFLLTIAIGMLVSELKSHYSFALFFIVDLILRVRDRWNPSEAFILLASAVNLELRTEWLFCKRKHF